MEEKNAYASWRAYAAFFIAGMKNSMAYRIDLVASLFFRVSVSLVMVAVWTAVYLNSKVTAIGGLTLPFMYAYFFLWRAVYIAVSIDTSETLQNDIQEGSVSSALIRPTNYLLQVLANSMGSTMTWSLIISIPLVVIMSLFASVHVTAGILGLFAVELLLGMVTYVLLDLIIGVFAVYLTNIWGLINLRGWIINILAGGIVPLSLFPEAIKKVVLLLPFQMLGFTEVATLFGIMGSGYVMESIMVSLVWIAILAVVVALWWRKAFRKITAVGG